MIASLVQSGRDAMRTGEWELALRGFHSALALLPRDGTVAQAAEITRLIGILHHQRGELEMAREACVLSLSIAKAASLRAEAAAARICLGLVEQSAGRLAVAERVFRQAAAVAEEIDDISLCAVVEHNLGIIANIRGDIEGALGCYRSALERHRRLGDEAASLGALNNMGMAHVDLGEWEAAENCFFEACSIAEQLNDPEKLGSIEINRAELYLKQGVFERARECGDRAFEIFGRVSSEPGIAEAHKFYGTLYRETAKPYLADTHFASAVELARRCHDRLLEAETMSEWAVARLAEERNREALQLLNGAHRLFAELHAQRELHDLDRRLDGLEGTYLRVVQAWGESIESKDRYTAGHCERVASYACMLAEAVGMGGRDLTWLRMGGYLHDVGKIAVPAVVLNKPGKLTDEEWAVMQAHTVEGDAIVADLNFPWDIRPMVRSHHERWDGSGYPDRLGGEEIPLTARILCLADVYDALTTTRSYRAALSREEALRIMESDVGRMFDPALFPLFRRVIADRIPGFDQRFPAFGRTVVAA